MVSPDYHINKTKFFNEKRIRLIHIFEDEWMLKKEIVQDKIKSILGIQKEKIYARSCTIKPISAPESNSFLEGNHIQGADKAPIRYGIFYKNELVAVMTFGKLRAALGNKKENSAPNTYELSRYTGKLGFIIVGGFSKLLKYIIKKHPEIQTIITYADLRWSAINSNVYLKNGFTLDHISEPSYYYTKNFNKREYRYKFRKSNLKTLFPDIYSKDKTEAEIMNEAGYTRIYDCGNLVYKMQIKRRIL